MPVSKTTNPSVVFKPTNAPQQFVPYDAPTAITLLANRGTLPPLYTSPTAVTTIPPGTVAHTQLNMKAKGTQASMAATMHDEG